MSRERERAIRCVPLARVARGRLDEHGEKLFGLIVSQARHQQALRVGKVHAALTGSGAKDAKRRRHSPDEVLRILTWCGAKGTHLMAHAEMSTRRHDLLVLISTFYLPANIRITLPQKCPGLPKTGLRFSLNTPGPSIARWQRHISCLPTFQAPPTSSPTTR